MFKNIPNKDSDWQYKNCSFKPIREKQKAPLKESRHTFKSLIKEDI